MSRGPGRWQRLILQTLRLESSVDLVDLLPKGYTASAYQAAYRAALTLEASGRIEVWRYIYGARKFVVARVGEPNPRSRVRLSVEPRATWPHVNTYETVQ